jgi:hypothetical protein
MSTRTGGRTGPVPPAGGPRDVVGAVSAAPAGQDPNGPAIQARPEALSGSATRARRAMCNRPERARSGRDGSIGIVDPAAFHPSRLIIAVALVLALCATPVAFGAPLLWVVYLLPVGVIVWVLWTRTTVDGEAVTVRRFTGTRRVPWESISSLRLVDTTRVAAVLDDGSELPLPAVGARDLPRLAAASGGRLPDPSGD